MYPAHGGLLWSPVLLVQSVCRHCQVNYLAIDSSWPSNELPDPLTKL